VLREADIGVRLRPRNAEALRALGKVAPFLQLGLELNNTARALSAMGEGGLGAKEAISLAGTVTDALALFQEDQGLEPTGELDEATRQKLGEVHGS
jgi:hypothetical protein